MFRPRVETPITKPNEPPLPQITGSWLSANVFAPIIKTLWHAGTLAAFLTYIQLRRQSLPSDLLEACLTTLVIWLGWVLPGILLFSFIHMGGPIWAIDFIERLFGVELDNQNTRKRLDNTPVGHILMEPWKGERAAELDARNRERIRMEQFIREAWRDSTTRNLDRKFSERDWHNWKSKLQAANWIIVDEPGRKNSTWHLRCPPDETIAGCFGMELEDVQKQRAG